VFLEGHALRESLTRSWLVGSRVKKRMLTDVTGTAGDEDTLSKKKKKLVEV
jgi:hypothetical protein